MQGCRLGGGPSIDFTIGGYGMDSTKALWSAWVGIDVSKKHLDVCVRLGDGRQIVFRVQNDPGGFAQLRKRVREIIGDLPALFCMESTGGYEFDVASFLCEVGESVSVVNPAWIKHFMGSRGYRNKTDRVDSRAIAEYACLMSPELWHLADPLLRTLCQLHRQRVRMMELFTRVLNWLEHRAHHGEFEVRQQLALRDILDAQLVNLEAEILRLVGSHEPTKRKIEALLPLTGMGMVFAVTLVCEMGEVTNYDGAQQYAAQAGLSPSRRESGDQRSKTRISKAGNEWVRAAGWMPAQAAMSHDGPVKELAERLKEKGLHYKQIRTAAMRKLVMQAFGVLKALANGNEPFYRKPKHEPGQPPEAVKPNAPAKMKPKLQFRPSQARRNARRDTYESPLSLKAKKTRSVKPKGARRARQNVNNLPEAA
jgi:transposase